MTPSLEQTGPAEGRQAAFWSVTAALTILVALCTPQRQNGGGFDDWEHNRAVLALSKDLWKPGNPTYATDEPSIRYSPYSLGLALLVRTGAVDSYGSMSLAAVLNTLLMALGVRSFLGAFGHRRLAPALLVVMVVLYGTIPGYANSYALADLPIQQVNPSAFSFALSLFMWSWFRRSSGPGFPPLTLLAIVVLGAASILSHAMTGAAGVIGLGVLAMAAPPGRRAALLARTCVVGAGILSLCVAWPWYDFVAAVRGNKEDAAYWYNGGILRQMLAVWSLPAALLAACALPLRDREVVRVGFLGAAVFYGLSVSSMVTRSPVTARFPMVGIFYLHVLAAAYIGDSALFRPGSWPGRLRGLLDRDYARAARPILDVIAALGLVYCLVPQLWAIVREPVLARAYVAPLLRFEDKQNYLKRRFDRLLEGVGDRDVVLSDAETSWPLPSSKGRIVAAYHLELFTKGQARRARDVEAFFSPGTSEGERRAILERYDVRWILLNRSKMAPEVVDALLERPAIAATDGEFLLMDARAWLDRRKAADGPEGRAVRPRASAPGR